MLEPHNRKLLIDSLQPPIDFKLDLAVCTTYSLDLVALLSAPVAFAFADAQDRDGRPLMDPLAILKATREYANRMLLFHHPGKIHVPKSYQSLLLSMEDSIAEALAPNGGSFHPKCYFLRFTSEVEVRYRFLCLSRNMTFDRSWDTSLSLEGPLTSRTNAISVNHPLGEFLESLPGMCHRGVSKEWKKRIEQMAYEVRRVEFEVPEGFESFRFWPIGTGTSKGLPFEGRCDRILVISPFVSDKQIKEFAEITENSKSVQLVSRADQIQLLSLKTMQLLKAIWTLDEAAEIVEDSEDAGDSETTENATTNQSQSVGSLSGLHAKVYILDQGWNARVLSGSANATNSAFNRNVEFLTELTGKKKFCGIDAVLGADGDVEGRANVRSLGDLLVPYQIEENHVASEDPQQAFNTAVDEFAKQVAKCSLSTRCEPNENADTFRLTLFPKKTPKTIQIDYEVKARLLSQSATRWFDIDVSAPHWLICDSISLVGLTSFFVFRIADPVLGIYSQFVVNAPLVNPPSGRHEALLHSILSDPERVQRFLMLLLGEGDPNRLPEGVAGDSAQLESSGNFSSSNNASLFETLMKAINRHPDKMRDAAKLIEELNKSEESRSRLPKDFHSIWDPIFAAWSSKYSAQPKTRGLPK